MKHAWADTQTHPSHYTSYAFYAWNSCKGNEIV